MVRLQLRSHESQKLNVDYLILLQASLRYRAARPGGDHRGQLPLRQPGHGVRGRGLGGGPAHPQHREVRPRLRALRQHRQPGGGYLVEL